MKFLYFFMALFMLGCTTVEKKPAHHTAISNKSFKPNTRVVIDPGHGGEDSGAVGKRGLLEKDVTLDIAKRLGRLFHRLLPQVEIVFTRTNDTYIALSERVAIANQQEADVFISLHINSSESKEASGFEIFSLDVASDRHAERLAASENKELAKKTRELDFILADLRAHSNRKDSDNLASLLADGVQSQLKKMRTPLAIVDRGYNQAIFHVLFVNMPAVIAELFFISNPKEEKMLQKEKARELIARGLFLGIKRYLEEKSMRASNDR